MSSCTQKEIGIIKTLILTREKALKFLIEHNIKKTNVYIGDLNLKLFSNSIEKDDFAIYKIIANHKKEKLLISRLLKILNLPKAKRF